MKVKCIKQSKMGGLEIGRIYELEKIKENTYKVIGGNCDILCEGPIENLDCDLFEYIED